MFSKGSVGVIFVDIYNLKVPHDKYGHQPIDEVIREVAEVLKISIRKADIACRYGGDEYLVILPAATDGETVQIAERIREAGNNIRVVVNGKPQERICLSVGLAHYPTIYNQSFTSILHGTEALLRAADEDLERDRRRNAEKNSRDAST